MESKDRRLDQDRMNDLLDEWADDAEEQEAMATARDPHGAIVEDLLDTQRGVEVGDVLAREDELELLREVRDAEGAGALELAQEDREARVVRVARALQMRAEVVGELAHVERQQRAANGAREAVGPPEHDHVVVAHLVQLRVHGQQAAVGIGERVHVELAGDRLARGVVRAVHDALADDGAHEVRVRCTEQLRLGHGLRQELEHIDHVARHGACRIDVVGRARCRGLANRQLGERGLDGVDPFARCKAAIRVDLGAQLVGRVGHHAVPVVREEQQRAQRLQRRVAATAHLAAEARHGVDHGRRHARGIVARWQHRRIRVRVGFRRHRKVEVAKDIVSLTQLRALLLSCTTCTCTTSSSGSGSGSVGSLLLEWRTIVVAMLAGSGSGSSRLAVTLILVRVIVAPIDARDDGLWWRLCIGTVQELVLLVGREDGLKVRDSVVRLIASSTATSGPVVLQAVQQAVHVTEHVVGLRVRKDCERRATHGDGRESDPELEPTRVIGKDSMQRIARQHEHVGGERHEMLGLLGDVVVAVVGELAQALLEERQAVELARHLHAGSEVLEEMQQVVLADRVLQARHHGAEHREERVDLVDVEAERVERRVVTEYLAQLDARGRPVRGVNVERQPGVDGLAAAAAHRDAELVADAEAARGAEVATNVDRHGDRVLEGRLGDEGRADAQHAYAGRVVDHPLGPRDREAEAAHVLVVHDLDPVDDRQRARKEIAAVGAHALERRGGRRIELELAQALGVLAQTLGVGGDACIEATLAVGLEAVRGTEANVGQARLVGVAPGAARVVGHELEQLVEALVHGGVALHERRAMALREAEERGGVLEGVLHARQAVAVRGELRVVREVVVRVRGDELEQRRELDLERLQQHEMLRRGTEHVGDLGKDVERRRRAKELVRDLELEIQARSTVRLGIEARDVQRVRDDAVLVARGVERARVARRRRQDRGRRARHDEARHAHLQRELHAVVGDELVQRLHLGLQRRRAVLELRVLERARHLAELRANAVQLLEPMVRREADAMHDGRAARRVQQLAQTLVGLERPTLRRVSPVGHEADRNVGVARRVIGVNVLLGNEVRGLERRRETRAAVGAAVHQLRVVVVARARYACAVAVVQHDLDRHVLVLERTTHNVHQRRLHLRERRSHRARHVDHQNQDALASWHRHARQRQPQLVARRHLGAARRQARHRRLDHRIRIDAFDHGRARESRSIECIVVAIVEADGVGRATKRVARF